MVVGRHAAGGDHLDLVEQGPDPTHCWGSENTQVCWLPSLGRRCAGLMPVYGIGMVFIFSHLQSHCDTRFTQVTHIHQDLVAAEVGLNLQQRLKENTSDTADCL